MKKHRKTCKVVYGPLQVAYRSLKLACLNQIWSKVTPSWLQVVKLDQSWAQVGSKLVEVKAKLAPSLLRKAQGCSPRRSREGPGRLLGSPWTQEALQEAPGDAKMISKSFQKYSFLTPKSSRCYPNSIERLITKSFQKRVKIIAFKFEI